MIGPATVGLYVRSVYEYQKSGLTRIDPIMANSYRNGDIIRVHDGRKDKVVVFVKFGENYYNLSENKQMKGYRFLPEGEKTIVSNLGGMGNYFLMDEEELNQHLSVEEPEEEGEVLQEYAGETIGTTSYALHILQSITRSN